METLKVAAIGGWSSVAGFKAVGVEPIVAASPADGPAIWDDLAMDRYAVVLITEPVFAALRERTPGFPDHEGLPVVLAIPAVGGSLGLGGEEIRKRVVKALGSVIEA